MTNELETIKFIQPFRKDNRVYRFAITASACGNPDKRVVISAHTSLKAANRAIKIVRNNPDFRIAAIDENRDILCYIEECSEDNKDSIRRI